MILFPRSFQASLFITFFIFLFFLLGVERFFLLFFFRLRLQNSFGKRVQSLSNKHILQTLPSYNLRVIVYKQEHIINNEDFLIFYNQLNDYSKINILNQSLLPNKMIPQLKDSIQIENSNVFYCQKGVKTPIKSQSKWKLGLIQQKLHLYNGFDTNIPLGNQAVRIIYKKEQCIYLRAKDSFYVLLIPFTSQQNDIIEYRLQSADVKLINWEQASIKAKDDIKSACGKNIQAQFSSNSSSSSKFNIAVKIGGLFGSINSKISKPMKQVNDAAAQKITAVKQQNLSEESKNKWERFKTKTSEINKNVEEIMKPAANKISGITHKIGDKFQNSQNSIIKGIRNFGITLRDSLNEGYANSRKSTKEQQLVEKPATQKVPQSERNLK